MNYLIGAFAVSWAVYFVYLIYLSFKLNSLNRRFESKYPPGK
ncbi:MAG: CcmD family protein [Planctomycetes bacterium]|nr:CcmD family protein [Planctomycetota bacterium]